jgi:methylenetetrahydrofolate reductase (NADPH)
MPVTSPTRLTRVLELSGEREPVELARQLETAESLEEQFAIGVEHSIRLANELLAGDAPALHLYTHNTHRAVLSVLEGVGLSETPSAALTNSKESA